MLPTLLCCLYFIAQSTTCLFLFFLLLYPPFSLLLNPPLLNPLTNIQYSEMASSILPKEFLPFELK